MKKWIIILKLILLLSVNIFVFVNRNPFVLSGLFLFVAIIIIPTKYSLLSRLKAILPICVIILLSQIIFYSNVSYGERVLFGYISALKIIIISLSVFVFLATTSLSEIVSIFIFLPKDWLLFLLITS
jgi:hypothetical protein